MKTCVICGREMGERAKKYCCAQCLREGKRNNGRLWRQKKREKERTSSGAARQSVPDVAEIARLAAEAGLSYGKYVEEKGL